jgi:hypothetical protein
VVEARDGAARPAVQHERDGARQRPGAHRRRRRLRRNGHLDRDLRGRGLRPWQQHADRFGQPARSAGRSGHGGAAERRGPRLRRPDLRPDARALERGDLQRHVGDVPEERWLDDRRALGLRLRDARRRSDPRRGRRARRRAALDGGDLRPERQRGCGRLEPDRRSDDRALRCRGGAAARWPGPRPGESGAESSAAPRALAVDAAAPHPSRAQLTS